MSNLHLLIRIATLTFGESQEFKTLLNDKPTHVLCLFLTDMMVRFLEEREKKRAKLNVI